MSQEQTQNNASFIQGSSPLPLDSTATQPVTVPNTTEFMNSLWTSASQGTIPTLISAGKTEFLNHFTNSPKITPVQHEALGKNRPGLTLGPNSTHAAAQYLVNKYDTARAANIISDNGNPDFLGRMSQLSGGLLGAASDIPGLAAATFAPELVGLKRAESLTGMADRAIQGAKFGAVEGAAFTTPAAAAQVLNDQANDSVDSFNGVQTQLNIGENMFLGGVLHPIGGFIKDKLASKITFPQAISNPSAAQDVADAIDSHTPIGADSANMASQSAVGQMMNGKDVNVGPILQQGAAAQDAALKANIEKTGINIPQVLSAMDDHELELNKKLGISNTETSLETLNSRLNQSILQKSDLPDDLQSTLKQLPVNDLNLGVPQMSEHMDNDIDSLNQKAQSIGLNPDEQKYLSQLTQQNSSLKDWIDQTQMLDSIPDPEIRDAKQQVQSMQDQLEQTKSQPELSDDLLKQKLTEMESKINELNPLVKNVKDRDVYPTKKLQDLISENSELRNQSTSMNMIRDSLTNPTEPIDQSHMRQYLEDMKTSSGNFKDSEAIPPFEETKGPSSEKSLLSDQFPEARQKELLKDAKLDAEELEAQKAIDDNEKMNKTRKSVIKAAINCILGNP